MPTLAAFDGIRVVMYYRDHEPPHFHVEYGEAEAIIRIADLEVLAGDLPPRLLNRVRAWAREKQPALALNWTKCRSHIAPDPL
ncbi:MAG: hypothetical protein RLY86_3042 [Pseudomonadota bacterium]|jgi:hypothetical protein